MQNKSGNSVLSSDEAEPKKKVKLNSKLLTGIEDDSWRKPLWR